MNCSNCGKEGHNARTCPDIKKEKYAVWLKVDNLDGPEQANELLNEFKKSKIKIAPRARATAATASEKDLPIQIKNVLQIGEEFNGKKEK